MKFLTLFLILFLCCCNNNSKSTSKTKISHNLKSNQTGLDSLKLDVNFKPKGNYNKIKNNIITTKNNFKIKFNQDKSMAINEASQYIYNSLLNDIIPFWYNTSWDFNGHTNIPNTGEIACGYFVSTTLKHAGFNLNRYKMAQKAGLDEAKLLQQKSELKIYSNKSFASLKQELIKVYKNGLYFVGLDNHVGYLLIKDKEIYFIHSSYYENKVMIELAETSYCFQSNLYVFAEITTNRALIKKWIFNEKLFVR